MTATLVFLWLIVELYKDRLFFFLPQSVVQVETLGEFGVFFILFAVGLEFSPDRIKKVM